VLAQTLGAAVYVSVVVRAAVRLRTPLRPDPAGVKQAGTAGFALLIRTICLRIVLLVAITIATRMGQAELAAYAIATQVWTMLAFILDAIAIAGQAITGRALGAGDTVATRTATKRMVVWGVWSGAVLTVVVLAVRPLLPGLFDADPQVTAHLLAVLWPVALFQPICGVVFVLDGVLIDAGLPARRLPRRRARHRRAVVRAGGVDGRPSHHAGPAGHGHRLAGNRGVIVSCLPLS
jgi:Na+-driven multidrug efflux pump